MIKPNATEQCHSNYIPDEKQGKDLEVQLVLAVLLGSFALLSFCTLRTRWPSLYAARQRRLAPAVDLPDLTDSFFGWMPQLWKITEEQVLAAAGLDAFVFLAFFKMAIRLFAIMAFFAIAVLLPINTANEEDLNFLPGWRNNRTGNDTDALFHLVQFTLNDDLDASKGDKRDKSTDGDHLYLWAHTVFTYLFVALTIYHINRETFRVIRYRQDYLGTQSTVTDRTFRLTGIPPDLRSEEGIKRLIDKLEIGQVQSVTICRDWAEIDTMIEKRDLTLRKLETAWAKYRQDQRAERKNGSSPQRTEGTNADQQEPDEEAGENGQLLQENHDAGETERRPHVKLRHGFLGLRHRKVDAIDYYEEKLRRMDEQIVESRKKDFKATDMALVTMDTVASCQMVTQARIDPRPGRLLTKPTPAPSDIVWKNTYSPRGIRRLKSWGVTIMVTIISIIFFVPTTALAILLSICTIERALPSLAEWLRLHRIIYSLVQNGLPTLVISLMNVAVPYIYDFLSNHQGMISQGDVELSVISKNFFFIFFNTFFVFAVSKSADFWLTMSRFIKDTSLIPEVIAAGVRKLSIFYANFIILQGIGLMPFRLLEVGTVVLTPLYRALSRTPRDYSELAIPPVFQYGFYLPTALLIFNLCLIYSVLSSGFIVLLFGVVYFALGYSTFKYMVLYAMDQPQHATGGAWRIICYRLLVGALVFEVVMIGSIASKQAFVPSVAILPLLPLTIWYSYYFKRRFEPLTKYIALRAIRSDEDPEDAAALDDDFEAEHTGRPSQGLLRRGSTIDEHKEKGLVFVNPSMVVDLKQPWIYDEPPPTLPNEETETDDDGPRLILPGLGEDNVWSASGS